MEGSEWGIQIIALNPVSRWQRGRFHTQRYSSNIAPSQQCVPFYCRTIVVVTVIVVIVVIVFRANAGHASASRLQLNLALVDAVVAWKLVCFVLL